MTTAWPAAKRQNNERDGCEPTTATGNKIIEAALTTSVRTPTRKKIAQRFARNMLRNPMGRGTRFVKSRRSRKMLSQRHSAAPPLTTMESTRKKYSSGMVAVNGSQAPAPRRRRISEPYFSNIRRETNRPGMASRITMTPTPMSNSSAPLLPLA